MEKNSIKEFVLVFLFAIFVLIVIVPAIKYVDNEFVGKAYGGNSVCPTDVAFSEKLPNPSMAGAYGIPLTADYDGDGKDDIAIFNSTTGTIKYTLSSNGSAFVFSPGITEWKPAIGDFDSDGKDDFGVFDSVNKIWRRYISSLGYAEVDSINFGDLSDIPVIADYDRDGIDDLAVFKEEWEHCYDGIKNSDETGTDCGGSCTRSCTPLASQIRCAAVITSNDDGFFSMAAFNGKLYAGEFGYDKKEHIKIFNGVSWTDSNPGLDDEIGESICYLLAFDGYLYANTENSAKVFRTSDGNNWQQVYSGASDHIGCGLNVFNNMLYKSQYDYLNSDGGRVHRTSSGTSWTQLFNSGSTNLYTKDIGSFNGRIYSFAVNSDNKQGGWMSSTSGDPGTWSWSNKGQRIFRSYNDGTDFWLGSAWKSAPPGGITGVWKLDGTNLVKKLDLGSSFQHMTGIRRWKGGLLATASTGFKVSCSGRAGLFYSSDNGNTWTRVCQDVIGEPEAWALEIYGDNAYFGTMCYNGHGKVYKVYTI